MSLQIGYVLPLLSTATGLMFVAHLPSHVCADLLTAERLHPEPGAIQIDEIELRNVTASARTNGLSRSSGLRNVGFAALSAPVFAHDGSLAGAMTIIGPSGDIDTSLKGRSATHLKAASAKLTHQIGG